MSKSNTKELLKIPLVTREDYYAIRVPSEKGRPKAVIITSIDDEEDKLLDKGETIIIRRGKSRFLIEPKNIYCYGEINFNNGSDDMDVISDFNWFDGYSGIGFAIPSNYNYETHSCICPKSKPLWYDTIRPELVAQYCHGFIGKPKKTVIFRIWL